MELDPERLNNQQPLLSPFQSKHHLNRRHFRSWSMEVQLRSIEGTERTEIEANKDMNEWTNRRWTGRETDAEFRGGWRRYSRQISCSNTLITI